MRQYLSQKNLNSDGLLSIIGKDFRYLRNVLRLSSGDMIYVRFPDGELKPMTVCKISESEKKITLQVCNLSENEVTEKSGENQSDFDGKTEFFLFMALPKSSKFDLIVRQAAECGVSRIIPVQTEFSQPGAEKMNFRSERFDRIVKEARQQSGSPVETKIESCVNLAGAVQIWKSEAENLDDEKKIAVVLYERSLSTVTIREACEKKHSPQKIALFCGSEGGLSPQEVKFLSESGFTAVHLKTNILRCETAALYGISALQSIVF
jgi:16S rRNA (uracil1498-N3)-methyltransferase